jgi:3-carboxy-cis,cis-muconate cycloisomerase
MIEIFGDETTLHLALRFQAELARAKAAVGVLPDAVAARIAMACDTAEIDAAQLAEEAAHAGTLAIPLVARLRAALAGETAAAEAVHQGATSQDLSDTVLMCQAQRAVGIVLDDLGRIVEALSLLAERHAQTPAVGRTLMQDALLIPFGLRVAQWLQGIERARRRLEHEAATALVVQLGGPVGARGGLAGKGGEVSARMAKALGLGVPLAPWHATRDGIAGLATALGIATGALGKMARDVALLAQNSIGELREPYSAGRGSSSAMAHKRNPTGAQIALSAAVRAPGLVSAMLSGMPQEAERGIGGWQAEAAVLAELFMIAGGAAAALAAISEELEVDEVAIADNVARSGLSDDLGEGAAIIAAILADARESR